MWLVGAEERGAYSLGSEGDHWGDLCVHGWIILGWIPRKWDVDWIGLAQDMDSCECSNEPSGSVQCGEFLD